MVSLSEFADYFEHAWRNMSNLVCIITLAGQSFRATDYDAASDRLRLILRRVSGGKPVGSFIILSTFGIFVLVMSSGGLLATAWEWNYSPIFWVSYFAQELVDSYHSVFTVSALLDLQWLCGI